MFDIYETDQIEIIKITQDDWGKETRTTKLCNARVEDDNSIFSDVTGNEVRGNMVIMVSSDIDIDYHDKIFIKKKNNVTFSQPNKEFLPRKITKWNNWIDMQTEIKI